MFIKVKELMNELIEDVTANYQEIVALKQVESNPMLYTEYSGRCFGIMEALIKIKDVAIEMDAEINQVLENTVDGQYAYLEKLKTDEIVNLQNQIHLLKKQLKAKNNITVEEKSKNISKKKEGNKHE